MDNPLDSSNETKTETDLDADSNDKLQQKEETSSILKEHQENEMKSPSANDLKSDSKVLYFFLFNTLSE